MRIATRPRRWSDHLQLIHETPWISGNRQHCCEELAAMDLLDGDVREAVRDTGYLASEALKLCRNLGSRAAIEEIWKFYRAEMERCYR